MKTKRFVFVGDKIANGTLVRGSINFAVLVINGCKKSFFWEEVCTSKDEVRRVKMQNSIF